MIHIFYDYNVVLIASFVVIKWCMFYLVKSYYCCIILMSVNSSNELVFTLSVSDVK